MRIRDLTNPTIFESFKSGKFENFFRQVVSDGCAMLGAEESEFERDKVKSWIKTHRRLFRNDKLVIYRTMQLEPAAIVKLKPGDELGNHWTFEFDIHNVEGFNVSLKSVLKELFVFEAMITTDDVAFPLTVAYNIFFPNENEIFLHSAHARPLLRSIRHLNTTTWTLSAENLRPDLIGKAMRA